jgi:hypothetical protein
MSDFRSKCIAAAASIALTAAVFLSLDLLAQASGVPSWIKASEAHAVAANEPVKTPVRI